MEDSSCPIAATTDAADGGDIASNPVLIDPDGDIILVVNNDAMQSQHSFVVSSRILTLASSVFSKMFSPRFKEGPQLLQQSRPVIRLEEDNHEAMETIPRIIHCQCLDSTALVAPQELVAISIHSDKYDLNKALQGWIIHWCTTTRPPKTPQKDWGLLLLAAYMFRVPNFSKLACEARNVLTSEFASHWQSTSILPLFLKPSQV